MGRKRINGEGAILVRLPPGDEERVVAVLEPSESKAEFGRKAVEREIRRREKIKPKDLR